MKRIVLFILSSAFVLGLFACSNESVQSRNNNGKVVKSSKEQVEKVVKKGDIREKIWNQLSSEQQEWINGTRDFRVGPT